MISIQSLNTLSRREVDRIVTGYSSTEKYTVSKIETEHQTTFSLELVKLPHPYHKVFSIDQGTFESFQEVIKQDYSLGAYDENRLVGLIIAEPRQWNNSIWVWELDIETPYQRQGIGRVLIEALADKAKKQHYRCLVCETQNTNVPAIRFYRSVGFEIDGIDLSYYTNEDVEKFEVAMFMKLKFSP